MGLWKTDFFNLKWFNAVCNSLPANVISLNKILAMPGLAGTPKDKKKHSSLSSKLELKGLVKPETASSIRISFQCIEELFQYIELWCDE